MNKINKKIIEPLKLFSIPCKENNYQPKILGYNFLFSLVFAFFILRVIVLPFYVYFPKTAFFAKIVSSEIVQLLNTERTKQGLNPLKENIKLTQAANLKARDMLDNGYFSHVSPEGFHAWHWIKEMGYSYQVAGENLAIGFLDSDEVHQAWNESASHKQNLLDPRFQEVGVAVLTGDFQGNKTTLVVQLFGEPQKIALSQANIIPEIKAQEPEKGDQANVNSNPVPVEEPEQITPGEQNGLVIENQESETEKQVEQVLPEKSIPQEQENVFQQIQGKEIQMRSDLNSRILGFFTQKYDQVVQNAIFSISALVSISLILNIVIVLKSPILLDLKIARLKHSAGLAITAVMILGLLGSIDKSFLIEIIPHSLKVSSLI